MFASSRNSRRDIVPSQVPTQHRMTKTRVTKHLYFPAAIVAATVFLVSGDVRADVYTFTLQGPAQFILPRNEPPGPTVPAFDFGTVTLRGSIDWDALYAGTAARSGFSSSVPDGYYGHLGLEDAGIEATGNRPGSYELGSGGLWFTLVGGVAQLTTFEFYAGSYRTSFSVPQSALPGTWMAATAGGHWVLSPAPAPFTVQVSDFDQSGNRFATGPVYPFFWTGPLTFAVAPIPEPGTLLLVTAGLAMVGGGRSWRPKAWAATREAT